MISVYKRNGTITHTAIVREVQKTDGSKSTTYCNYGTPTLVENKWGGFPQVKHPPTTVPDSYLPPDNPNTPEREGLTYYQPPNRQPPVNTGDPGKDKHTLKKIP